MSIEDTPEWKQSINMRPACNRVLKEVFGISEDSIVRYQNKDHPHVLDKEFAIDLKVRLENGMSLSGQEKSLSHKFYSFKTFTIEFWQNRYTEEPGEWFKIASQFYLHGYSDKTGKEFAEWYILKMFDFMNWLKGEPINKLKTKLRPAGGSRAAFLPIEYNKIPDHIIYAQGSSPGETKIYDTPQNIAKQSPQNAKLTQATLF